MLDLDWERSIPIINIQLDEIKDIFFEFDQTISVLDYNAIHLGCRNSNFVVDTNRDRYLLRLASMDELNNELVAYDLMKDKINIPSLLFHTTKEKRNIFIYQYISGVSLQQHIVENNRVEYDFIEQVAKASAIIHNTPKEIVTGLAEYEVPPFELWYQYFLENSRIRARLGEVICQRVQRLVIDKQKFISEINAYQSFIHCDFRPANMMVDENRQVYFVDWESASIGHSLADIGQFFRYRFFFNHTHIRLFEDTYNVFARKKLPNHWFELSLFRDLVNPLQMLSSNHEAPLRNEDLLKIIEGSLSFWGY